MYNSAINNWLNKDTDPSFELRVKQELFDTPMNNTNKSCLIKQIEQSKAVTKLLSKMHPDGYWLQTNPRTKKTVGSGVEYGSFATTHFCLSYLAELGLTKKHSAISKASERYLSLQQSDGDWWGHMSCLSGLNLVTFCKLGYKNDNRVQKNLELMLNTPRTDGGFLCDMHERTSGNKVKKSCIRGSSNMLYALSYYPEKWGHSRCKQLIDYFINRNGIFKTNSTEFVNRDMERLSFPVTWSASAWQVLYALSAMGYGKHKNLKAAWQYIETKTNPDGSYNLEHTPAQCPWKVGKRGEPNKWITFYVEMAKKYKQGKKVET